MDQELNTEEWLADKLMEASRDFAHSPPRPAITRGSKAPVDPASFVLDMSDGSRFCVLVMKVR